MKFKVIHAEVSTGIVVDSQGNRLLGMHSDGVEFETEFAAREYALECISLRPDIECAILNQEGLTIDVIRDENYVNKQLTIPRKAKGFLRRIFGLD